MRAFKFRSLENLDRVLGMIRSGDVWCAKWQDLNDPMEGLYFYDSGDDRLRERQITRAIRTGKQRRFVCALSARWDKTALWAYYADDFRGVALEYDLQGLMERNQVIVDMVQYRSANQAFDIFQSEDAQALADQILLTKIDDWRHEEEIRILSSRPERLRIPGGVRSLTLGHRMPHDVKELMAIYCARRDVACYEMKIGPAGLEREEVDNGLFQRSFRRP